MNFEQHVTLGADRLQRTRETRQLVKIFTHIDADGLAAGAILGKALWRAQIPFQVRTLRQLEPKFIEQIARNYRDSPFLVVFSDFGSGQLNVIAKLLPPRDVVICDHHEITPDASVEFPYHYNPALYGNDGVKEISGAGMSYFLARALNPNNMDLAEIAIVGAIGDRQTSGEGHSVIGMNQDIVEDGIAASVIDVVQGVRIFGRETRSIASALSMSTEPYLKGLTGNQGACEMLLVNMGLSTFDVKANRPRTLADLSKEETQTLMSTLVNFCVVNLNLEPNLVLDLIGTVYRFPREPEGKPLRDAQEYATLLNSCGRTGHSDLGIAIGMGDRRDALHEADAVLAEYRKSIREILESLERGGTIKLKGSIYVLDAGNTIDEKMIGAICSVALVTLPPNSPKPLIGVVSSEDETVKVSGRAPGNAIGAGVDLGKAMRMAATELGVQYPAGGHPAAAGAKIPSSLKEKFLNLFEQKIGEMLSTR
ncbi:MAG: archaea-specific RecJ-like exonuclease [Promethearchaeota archaeon CR_4]|nr:MAG: archaea-specific RecJ-like exonuclease [Candidatus Lokiarchaeota archaeon CR_4]